MRVWLPAGYVLTAMAVVATGCNRTPASPSVAPPAAKPAGRLVPAVVSGFERGLGGWQVDRSGDGVSGEAPAIEMGGASRGDRWLAVPVTSHGSGETVLDVQGNVPSGDWTRFGDTLRSDVRVVPGGAKATVELYVVSPDGKETLGPRTDVTSAWKTVAWSAGGALGNVARVGLRWRVSGDWTGRLGIDNVRVGAADALAAAFSVVTGPYANRDVAAEAMKVLGQSGIKSFPIYEQGWYLNLGTFSSRPAAQKEAARLKQKEGLGVTVLAR